MKHPKTVSLIVALIVFGSVAGAAWALGNFAAPGVPQSKPMPKLDLSEQIRNDAVAYFAANHPETVQFMDNITWTGGAVETFAPPETYIYNSQGWTMMIQYPLKEGQSYNLNVEYVASGVGVPYRITWTGTWIGGNITETSFVFAQ